MEIRLNITKRHVVLISLAFLLASASATVEVRDTLQVEGILDMKDNRITGLGGPEEPADAANKRYVDNSGSGGFYGYGSDGEKTVSGTETVSGIKYYEGLTVEPGATLEVGSDRLVVFSTERILVEGSISAEGAASNGGSGGTDPRAVGQGGSNGGAGIFGEGGDGGGGGAGGDSAWESAKIERLSTFGSPWRSPYSEVIYGDVSGGAGGGGGEPGSYLAGGRYGEVSGGDGGGGGGVVVLLAPRVKVEGRVNADGQDGQDGGNIPSYITPEGGGARGGGGGGGGAGGLIALAGGQVDASGGDLSIEGGDGGSGGGGNGPPPDGNNGSAGRAFVLG